MKADALTVVSLIFFGLWTLIWFYAYTSRSSMYYDIVATICILIAIILIFVQRKQNSELTKDEIMIFVISIISCLNIFVHLSENKFKLTLLVLIPVISYFGILLE